MLAALCCGKHEPCFCYGTRSVPTTSEGWPKKVVESPPAMCYIRPTLHNVFLDCSPQRKGRWRVCSLAIRVGQASFGPLKNNGPLRAETGHVSRPIQRVSAHHPNNGPRLGRNQGIPNVLPANDLPSRIAESPNFGPPQNKKIWRGQNLVAIEVDATRSRLTPAPRGLHSIADDACERGLL
jgi:hypothetical protein